MTKPKNTPVARGVAYTALLLGTGALTGFMIFLYTGTFSVLDLGFGPAEILFLDAGLSLLFFLQHSIMLRKGFRARALKYIPSPYFAPLFAISSSLALFSLMIAWQESSYILFSAEGMVRLLFRLLFLASVVGFAWSARALNSLDAFGTKTLLRHIKNRGPEPSPLTIQGPYKFVRHPLYSFSLLMIWSSPEISADRLLFNGLWTAWIITGTLLEEKDLVRDFGEAYQKYQKTVPMLIPLKLFFRQ